MIGLFITLSFITLILLVIAFAFEAKWQLLVCLIGAVFIFSNIASGIIGYYYKEFELECFEQNKQKVELIEQLQLTPEQLKTLGLN